MNIPKPKKLKRYFTYSCLRCFFNIDDDEQRMIDHCLKVHGSTGQFGKGYKKIKKYRG